MSVGLAGYNVSMVRRAADSSGVAAEDLILQFLPTQQKSGIQSALKIMSGHVC